MGFFEWDEREQHVEESKKAEDGRREEGANPRSALGWRGAREELADFGNPSFISVKPSSAECRLTDITELLTADCLYADCLLDLLHQGPKGTSLPFSQLVNRQSIKEAFSPGRENSSPSLLIPARSQPRCLAQQASCVLAEHRTLP